MNGMKVINADAYTLGEVGSLSVCLPIIVVKNLGDVITLNKSLQEFNSFLL